MKTIIYGNDQDHPGKNGDPINRVQKVLEGLVDFAYLIKSNGQDKCLEDYKDAGVESVIFVGICPEEEIKIALAMGMKVFILLACVEDNLLELVTIAQTKSLADEERLRHEIQGFFDGKSKELKYQGEEAC